MQSKLVGLHEEIISTMKNTYEVFKTDGHDVRCIALTCKKQIAKLTN